MGFVEWLNIHGCLLRAGRHGSEGRGRAQAEALCAASVPPSSHASARPLAHAPQSSGSEAVTGKN